MTSFSLAVFTNPMSALLCKYHNATQDETEAKKISPVPRTRPFCFPYQHGPTGENSAISRARRHKWQRHREEIVQSPQLDPGHFLGVLLALPARAQKDPPGRLCKSPSQPLA